MEHFNFVCKVVALGHAFLLQLCDAMKGVQLPLHKVWFTKGMKQDLEVRLSFLEGFNGVSFWRKDFRLEVELQIHLDAAGSLDFGVYFREHWCMEKWPQDWVSHGWTWDLMFLEVFPILVVVWLWRKEMANCMVHFWCNSMAVVQIVNSLFSKPEQVMQIVRVFMLHSL